MSDRPNFLNAIEGLEPATDKPVNPEQLKKAGEEAGFTSREGSAKKNQGVGSSLPLEAAQEPEPVSKKTLVRRYSSGRDTSIHLRTTSDTAELVRALGDHLHKPLGEVIRLAANSLLRDLNENREVG